MLARPMTPRRRRRRLLLNGAALALTQGPVSRGQAELCGSSVALAAE
jgi:hypothetical protein